ncbi:TetR family transcriptional regulator [Nocardia stercoris]|uniref:TetR family transcriptional regulator n=1 Tax=Nocardia stercoris TaxID=2483361 RepID=UPI001F420995|nr:TetR family transcriptional regulator [Nocardia stercoris]
MRTLPLLENAVEQAASSLNCTGTRALRVLLHAGISSLFPAIKAKPDKHIRGFETCIAALQRRWEAPAAGCSADPDVVALFRALDGQVASFLQLCADRSGTMWIEPLDSIAAYALAVVHGSVLRWLADCNDETTLVVLDDLVSCLAAKAVDR